VQGADAIQVGGAGGNGADVKATDPFGHRGVIQCKHRRHGLTGSPAGTPDLHVLNGTARQLHGADVVVLVTNGRFSAKCPCWPPPNACTWWTGTCWDDGRPAPGPCGPPPPSALAPVLKPCRDATVRTEPIPIRRHQALSVAGEKLPLPYPYRRRRPWPW